MRYLAGLSVSERVQLALSTLIRLSLLVAFILALVEGIWTVAFVSIGAFIVTLLPWFLARTYQIFVPIGFEFALVLFVYAALFLGEVHSFYERFWWWDVVLHAGSGMTIGFIGFLIPYSLYRDGRFQAQPFLIAFLSFSIAIAIGALWEIFEFAMDSTLGFNMQKNGLVDTMWDLIVNVVGALIASGSGYVYLRYKLRGLGIFHYYVESFFPDKGKGGTRKDV